MPDILIRGMDKPGSFHDCDFCRIQDVNFETFYYCERNDRFLDDEEACNIPNDCPIIELPPHGDLISLEAAKTVITRFLGYIDDDLVFRIKFMLEKDCHVIVPANKEETE